MNISDDTHFCIFVNYFVLFEGQPDQKFCIYAILVLYFQWDPLVNQ